MNARFRALNLIMAVVMAMGLVFTATSPSQVQAAAFTNGNIVIYRVGDGSTALAATGNPVFLDEYNPSGTLVQSVAMPQTADGLNKAFFAHGTSTAEGLLTRSADANYLLLTGYASTYASALSGTTGAVVNRVVGRVDGSGNINTTTALTDFASSGNPRSATSTNGTDLWFAGNPGGVRYATLGTTGTSTQISTSVANMRQVNIYGGQLYGSDASGSAYRLSSIGSGTPTTSGQTFTNLPGLPTGTGSPYAFFFADLDVGVSGVDTLYVVDDNVPAGTGGIYKYSFVSPNWVQTGGLAGLAADNYRGLTGIVSGTTVTLFATRKGSELVSLVDTAGYNAPFSATTPTLLATAGTNMAFRGVALAPNPPDIAPTVTSTVPTNTAINVAIDATITVNFSEPVTASGTWATLSCGGPSLDVTLGGSGSSYTITPDSPYMPYEASCTATVVAAQITDLDGSPTVMATDYVWGFGTAADLPPTVSSTVPADTATDVAVDSTLTVNFSEPVTATGTWGTLTCDSLPVSVTLGGGGSVYTIDPNSDLPNSVSCTATVVAAQVTDLDGTPDAMALDYSWSFTTAAADIAPTVDSTVPATGAINVAVDSDVTITFSEPVTAPAGFSFIVCDTSGMHNLGAVTGTGTSVIVFNPEFDFTRGESCTVTIDHTKVYDTDGTPTMMVADYVWSFTILPPDLAPTVSSTVPTNGATDVALDATLTVNFSELVTAADVWATLVCGGLPVAVTLGGSGSTFTIDPDTNLPYGSSCTATVLAAQITDQDADDPPDVMATDYSWTFTTVYDPAPTVTGVTPLNAATGVALNSNLTATFSEAVDLAAGAVSLSCSYSGVRTTVVSTTDDLTFTIDPDVDLPPSEKCTATLENTLITDKDTNDPYDTMAADYSWYFTTYYDQNAITPIAVARAAGVGWTGTIQGNVTVLTGLLGTRSFTIQDATGGMYVYPNSGSTIPTMAMGDVVKVKGTINLYGTMLQELVPSTLTSIKWISTGAIPAPLEVATGSIGPTQGKLIQVEGTVTWTGTPTPGTNYTIRINDGSGLLDVYIYRLTNISVSGFTSGQQIRIIGMSSAYNAPQIQPRYQSDLIDLRPPTVTGTDPASDATGVSPHRPINATFSKAMDPDSLDGHFTLTDDVLNPVSGTVSYIESTHTAVFTPASALAENATYTATLSTDIQDSYGVDLADPVSWSFTTGTWDTIHPSIVSRSPGVMEDNVSVGKQIEVGFSEDLAPSSLVLDKFILIGPYGVVPAELTYDPVSFVVTLTPEISLLYNTQYQITVDFSVADYAGNQLDTTHVWSFTTLAEPPMQVYFGDLHNHTSYSDGSGTPSQALTAGQAAGFDFMAISDHSYAIDDTEWANTLTAVESATGTDFVAIRGYEYTQGAEGHINVYNSVKHAVRTNTGCSTAIPSTTMCVYTPNLEAGSTVLGFYQWLVSSDNTSLDAAGKVMQFNHPGWINFNDWFFHPEASGIAKLEEVGNGSGSSYVFSEAEFIRSLDYGWKLGATNNADTHSTYWGTNTDDRTGVIMPELTKTALLEALRLRHTFATEDKNASLTMKANGSWMGSEIVNTGSIHFVVNGSDTDGEQASLVQLITDQGEVAAIYTPISSTFTWEQDLTITPGVHYYYVKVTQADGDRVVTSPVWTMGSEDVSITDLTIQPTIPTTHNPSLLTVRVTNRIVAQNRIVHIILKVDDVQQGSAVEVTVPSNGDGYANFSWQPTATGDVTVSAEITDAPAGDNPDDNSAHLHLTVTDELLPLILIDAGHGNMNADGNDMKPFVNDLSAHGYNVLKNLDTLTVDDLNPTVVKLLMITAPQFEYTPDELTAIANYVAAGGSLWIGGLADYNASLSWADTVANRENAILDAIETVTGQTVNMRMNDDEVIDGNSNNGYVFGVYWQDFPGADTTGIGMNVETVSTWSLSSIVDGSHGALTADDPGVQIVMQGDLDEGYTSDSFRNPFHTNNTDYDGMGDAYIYNSTWVYPTTKPAGAIPLPGAAVVDLSPSGAGAGRIMLYGDSNDPFTIFAYTAGDGKQNELFNLQSVMWLLGEQLQKSTIAEARAQGAPDQPDNLDKVVWIEGEITAAYGEFFNVLYVQDATGGITVHAPAGDIDPSAFSRGTHVRAVGTVGIYEGDTEVEFFEAEMVQVIPGDDYNATPLSLTTTQASLEENQGWLTVVSGTVMSKTGTDTLIVDDGSGPVRIFLDGYNGSLADIHVMDRIQVTGLISEDGAGGRIRVRNHNFHLGVDDDVILLSPARVYYFPLVVKIP